MIRDDPRFAALVKQFFDIWHIAKSIATFLKEMCKLKRNECLLPWSRPIVNHFWYSCRNSGGDRQKLVETFHSFLLHISNSHTWTTGVMSRARGQNQYPSFTSVLKCGHGQLKKIHLRRGAWVKRSSPTFKELTEKVTAPRLCADMMNCSDFLHTGSLENYHSVRLKYLPKRIAFGRETTVIRSMLTIIETNKNVLLNLNQNESDSPVKMYASYSKASAKWVLKKRYQKKDYSYRSELLDTVKGSIISGRPELVDMSEYIPKDLPKNMAPVPRPPLEEMLLKHKSRLQKLSKKDG